jgi:hypothetical protein
MVKWAEIRNKQGETQWTVWLNPRETKTVNSTAKQTQPQTETQTKPQGESPSKEGPGDNHDRMTDAQKRYLFRLLADQGIEGEDAYKQLKKTFGVEYLKDVTKQEASRAIDQLLKGEGEVKDDEDIPFP